MAWDVLTSIGVIFILILQIATLFVLKWVEFRVLRIEDWIVKFERNVDVDELSRKMMSQ